MAKRQHPDFDLPPDVTLGQSRRSSGRLKYYRPIRDWVIDEAEDAFPTFASWEWFFRRHRKELIDSGEFIVRRGPAGSLAGPGLGDVVMAILVRESKEYDEETNAA